VLSKKDRI